MFHYSYEPYNGDSPLHPFDYPYFHKNIRINVNERVNSFFEKKGETISILSDEKCFECGKSSDCWNQMFGDFCMVIVLPIISVTHS